MKKLSHLTLLFLFCLFITNVSAQNTQQPDSLGLPGDNLNLYAVLQLFQESPTLEGFERKLISEETKINNLDLNNDNKIDYIKVIDHIDGTAHNIVLQVSMNEKENQDVAYFIVDKNDKGGVQIQLIGDEALYGKDYIVEPNYTETTVDETPNPGYVKQSTQQSTDKNGNTTIINNYTSYETASWPVVRYMYEPNYVIWISPWRWFYYPDYWTPWEPWYWHRYYGYHYFKHNYYYGNYRSCHNYRSPLIRTHYYNNRHESTTYRKYLTGGSFRKTYTRPNQNGEGKLEYFQDRAIEKPFSRTFDEVNPKIKSDVPTKPIRKIENINNFDQSNQKNNQPARKSLEKTPSRLNVDDNEKPRNTRPSRGITVENIKPNNTRPSRERTIDNIKIQKNQSSGSGRKIENGRRKP